MYIHTYIYIHLYIYIYTYIRLKTHILTPYWSGASCETEAEWTLVYCGSGLQVTRFMGQKLQKMIQIKIGNYQLTKSCFHCIDLESVNIHGQTTEQSCGWPGRSMAIGKPKALPLYSPGFYAIDALSSTCKLYAPLAPNLLLTAEIWWLGNWLTVFVNCKILLITYHRWKLDR